MGLSQNFCCVWGKGGNVGDVLLQSKGLGQDHCLQDPDSSLAHLLWQEKGLVQMGPMQQDLMQHDDEPGPDAAGPDAAGPA